MSRGRGGRWESQPGTAEVRGEGRDEAARVCGSQPGHCGDDGTPAEMKNWGQFRFGSELFEELRGRPGGASCEGPQICSRCTRRVRTEGGSHPEGEPPPPPRKQPHGQGRGGALSGEQSAARGSGRSRGAGRTQDAHLSVISRCRAKRFSRVRVSRYCTDKGRGLERGGGTRGMERLFL